MLIPNLSRPVGLTRQGAQVTKKISGCRVPVSPERDMRRMCGKSLYQEASAARRTDDGKRVESAKERATKIACPAQSD
jgi:hypothetical protein